MDSVQVLWPMYTVSTYMHLLTGRQAAYTHSWTSLISLPACVLVNTRHGEREAGGGRHTKSLYTLWGFVPD